MGSLTRAPERFLLIRFGFIALGVGVLSLIPYYLVTQSDPSSPAGESSPAASKIAYVEFGRNVDTLWLASPDEPGKRDRLLAVEHAMDFGIVPSLSPDSSRFVFTALTASTKAPSPDTPAGLWLAPIKKESRPEAVAANVDLLVKPVWRPDSSGVVVRRSTATTPADGEYRLVYVDLETRSERDIALARGLALFPIAFTRTTNELLVARLSSDASDLLALDIASGAAREVGVLASGLTRDWSLSPSGDRVAYLEMTLTGAQAGSRAYVLDLATGVRTTATDGAGDDFAPVWSADGSLTIGRAGANGSASGLITLRAGEAPAIQLAPSGFDVPLAASPADDGLAVRSFDGASAIAPGRPVLTVIRPDGARTPIAGGEVTFLGWTNP
jgi:Tol biopolymer transport system component